MRPVGWRRESYRHALAARGVPTSYYSRKRVDFIKGGLADGSRVSDFDSRQLRMGIKVEMEHTKDPKVAREIAMDHLKEYPDYYTELGKMERRLERRKPRRYNYVPAYVASDLPLIAGDAVGTVGAETVSLVPVIAPVALLAGGLWLGKKAYDKSKGKKK